MTHPDRETAKSGYPHSKFDRVANRVLKGLGILSVAFVVLIAGGILLIWLAMGNSYSRHRAISGSNLADFIHVQGGFNDSWRMYIPSHKPQEIGWVEDANYQRGGFANEYWTQDGAVLVIMVTDDQKEVPGFAYDFSQQSPLGIDCGQRLDTARNAAITRQIQQLIDLHGGLKLPGINVRKEATHIFFWQSPD